MCSDGFCKNCMFMVSEDQKSTCSGFPETRQLGSLRILFVCQPVRLTQRSVGAPQQRELFDGSLSQASRIEEGAEDNLWHSVFTTAYCATRKRRAFSKTDQARAEP